MKMVKLILISNVLSIVLGIGAIYLAISGIKGWGWFLLCAILTYSFISEKSVNQEK